MATNVFDLVAKLSLDSSEYEKGLGNAENKGANFGSGLEKSTKKMKKGITAFAVGGAAALGAFAISSVKTGATFDSSMSQVAATMGMTMNEMNKVTGETDTAFGHFSGTLRDFAQYMGSNTAFSASQAADALNYMALAGYDAQTSMDMLPNVLNLAAAGGIDLAAASDMVTDAQSALGLTLDETTAMVDQMAKTSSKSNTSVAQLGEAFLTIGATARNLAGGTTELSTVLGVLADNGIKGAEGGTHLRNMLLSLQTPTEDGTKALAKLGMTYNDMYDSAGNMRSIPEIMLQLQSRMEGMTQASKDAIISGIFNRTDLAAANALIGTSKERFDELTVAITDSKDAASEMAKTQLDNLEGDITLLKSAFEGLQISIAERLTPALRGFVQFLTQLIGHFNQLLPIIVSVSTAIGVFAIAINIGSIIRGVTTAFAAFNAVLMANPIGLVVALVAGLVAAIVTLWNTNDGFREAVIEAWNTIKEAAQQLFDKVQEIFQAIGDKISETFESIKEWGRDLIEKVKAAIQSVWEAIQKFRDDVVSAWENIQEAGATLRDKIHEIFDSVKEKITSIVDAAKSWGSDLIENFVSGIKNGFGKIKSAMSGLADVVRSHIHFSEPDAGPLSDFHTYAPDMMKQFAKGIDENLPLVEDSMNRMGSMVRGNMQLSAEGVNRGATYNGGITINIYQREGENDTEFARRIADIINSDVQRKRAVYA